MLDNNPNNFLQLSRYNHKRLWLLLKDLPKQVPIAFVTDIADTFRYKILFVQ